MPPPSACFARSFSPHGLCCLAFAFAQLHFLKRQRPQRAEKVQRKKTNALFAVSCAPVRVLAELLGACRRTRLLLRLFLFLFSPLSEHAGCFFIWHLCVGEGVLPVNTHARGLPRLISALFFRSYFCAVPLPLLFLKSISAVPPLLT